MDNAQGKTLKISTLVAEMMLNPGLNSISEMLCGLEDIFLPAQLTWADTVESSVVSIYLWRPIEPKLAKKTGHENMRVVADSFSCRMIFLNLR